MYNIDDYVVYKKEVCKIKSIKKNHLNNKDYYVLVPINDDSLVIDVPTDNRCGYIRPLVSKEEINKIISKIPMIPIVECNTKNIENEYKVLLANNDHESLIKIIKTTYLRNKERIDNNKKIGDKDNEYFKKAEKYLYNEFGVVLNMNFDEVKKYIVDKITLMEEQSE